MQRLILFFPWDPINPLKASNFEIWSNWQDWIGIYSSFENLILCKNQIWFALNGDWFLPKTMPNPSNINTWGIPIEREQKNCSKNPIPKLKKPWCTSKWEPYFQPFSIVFEVSNTFLGISRIDPDPYIAQNHSESQNPCLVCSWKSQIRLSIFMHY